MYHIGSLVSNIFSSHYYKITYWSIPVSYLLLWIGITSRGAFYEMQTAIITAGPVKQLGGRGPSVRMLKNTVVDFQQGSRCH